MPGAAAAIGLLRMYNKTVLEPADAKLCGTSDGSPPAVSAHCSESGQWIESGQRADLTVDP